MIPKTMEAFLRERLPDSTWQNRLICEDGRCYIEFHSTDIERLARLGIEADNLGPRLVVAMWDEAAPLEAGGYLVVDNLAMGQPSMGGIRMLPDLTPLAIHNLARGMTLKNAAAHLPYGGGKSGIVAERGLSPADHTEVVRRFARLLYRYHHIYLPGPDVGTNDEDMRTVAIENGLDNALSKPADMGGNRIDELGAAAGGVIIALQALLEEMERLKALPQFAGLEIPAPDKLTVLIQGFGAVGAHAARILRERIPGAKVVGISDASGYLYDDSGLPVDELFAMWQDGGVVCRPFFMAQMSSGHSESLKYATQPNDLLRESAFCLIPAAPIANYLDTDPASGACMTVDRMGRWRVSIEGANTYSPDPARRHARTRLEQVVYRQKGLLLATDYLVNSGGVIFAAQEKLIKTPPELRPPGNILGDRAAVEGWQEDHAGEFEALAARRLAAAQAHREKAMRDNMREFIDLLLADADRLPSEAAEQISVRRIAARESARTAAELMEEMPTVTVDCTLQQAAARLVEAGCSILAVVTAQGELAGVVTEWDITRAAATGAADETPATELMTREVIATTPGANVLELVRQLEYYDISAMPVVENGVVVGMIDTDLLTRQSLLRLLQSQAD